VAALRDREMGDFLNIIGDDLDVIDFEHYFVKGDDVERMSYLKKHFEYFKFNKYKECTLLDAYKNPNEKYYYFISRLSTFSFFENTIPFTESLITGLKTLNNVNIILLSEHESVDEENFIKLNDFLIRYNINGNKIHLINNNSLLNFYKSKHNSEINVLSTKFLPIFYSKLLNKHKIEFSTNREFLFMCHNKRMKSHRVGVLAFLKKTNIINDVDWSFVFDSESSIDYDLSSTLKEEIGVILKNGSVKSKYEIDHVFKFGDPGDYICEDTFSNAYLNITTETNFITEDVHITEKSFKPFFFYQIPIFLSSAFHVKKLKEIYGFDLFEDVVNHNYDNETNFKKRFSLVCDEINRIYNNRDEIKKFIINNKERFLKNNEIVSNIINDKTDYNYFESLM
jgi:hypothetical protein